MILFVTGFIAGILVLSGFLVSEFISEEAKQKVISNKPKRPNHLRLVK